MNQLISNTANENIKPPIYPFTEIININEQRLIVLNVRQGESKPYQTSKGIYLTKSGSDKRRMSSEELRRLFAESQRLFADEEILLKSVIGDLNSEAFYDFLNDDNPRIYDEIKYGKLKLATVLHNLDLLKKDHLTLAGNLIFGKTPQKFSPSFYIDCAYFDNNHIETANIISKTTIKGTLLKQYSACMLFIKNNLRNYALSDDFNAQTKLEIDQRVITELLVNALVHRDYYIQSSIKIFIYPNRLEIINPGKLTNSLTVEKIKNGISIHRNPILNSICKNILPYSGYGSGIKRILSLSPDTEFINDIDKEEFRGIVLRRIKYVKDSNLE
jgi:predicted HTH transcriptional regulator